MKQRLVKIVDILLEVVAYVGLGLLMSLVFDGFGWSSYCLGLMISMVFARKW